MKAYFKRNLAPLTFGFFAGIAMVLIAFGASHWLYKWQLKAEQGRIWEIILKAVAGAVGIVGAIITAFKYIDDKALQRGRDLTEQSRQKDLDRREDAKQRGARPERGSEDTHPGKASCLPSPRIIASKHHEP